MFQPDALVLCGGQSARLGGIDKPLRMLAGRALIERVLDRLIPQCARVVLSANRNRERYAAFGHPVVDDGLRADRGPLAGLAAGMKRAATEFLLCVPGDAPQLPADLAARLMAAGNTADADVAYVHDGRGPQPLCALIRRSLLADLERYLDLEGGSTPREWFDRHLAIPVDFSEQPTWVWSLNTEEEWQRTEHTLARPKLAP